MAAESIERRRTYTLKEVAELLGISVRSAYAGAAAGEIPTVKIGRRILVPRQALEKMLMENETGPD